MLIHPMHMIRKQQHFAQGLDFIRFQVAIYKAFNEESESEVEKCQILEPGWKINEKPTLGIRGPRFLSTVECLFFLLEKF